MEQKKNTILGPMLILVAGVFWGSMGIFVRRLGVFGFTSIQIVCIRVVLAALIFSLILLFKEPSGFRISLRDLPLFLGLGLGSVLFFTVCYFSLASVIRALMSSWISSSFVIASRSSIPVRSSLNKSVEPARFPCLGGNWLASRYILM